ncbi:MAG TPA: hypothetical protein VHN15_14845 [Thermoanaerobaculia bacterium]|nr:hypothetical protein [Thermoanaerobaculia bacterium]
MLAFALVGGEVAWSYVRSCGPAGERVKSGLFLWLALFLIVSMQVATVVRPVLVWDGKGALFTQGKMFFLEHLGRVYDQDEQARREAARRESEKRRQEEAKAAKEKGARDKEAPAPAPASATPAANGR